MLFPRTFVFFFKSMNFIDPLSKVSEKQLLEQNKDLDTIFFLIKKNLLNEENVEFYDIMQNTLVCYECGIESNSKYFYSHSLENWVMIKNNWEDIIKIVSDFFTAEPTKDFLNNSDRSIFELNDKKNHVSNFLDKEIEKVKKVIKEIENIVDFYFYNSKSQKVGIYSKIDPENKLEFINNLMSQIEKTCKKDENFLKQIIDYLKDFQSIQQTKILIEQTHNDIKKLKKNKKNFFEYKWSTINKYFRKNIIISLKFLEEMKNFLPITTEKIENFQYILKVNIDFIDKKVKNNKNTSNQLVFYEEKRKKVKINDSSDRFSQEMKYEPYNYKKTFWNNKSQELFNLPCPKIIQPIKENNYFNRTSQNFILPTFSEQNEQPLNECQEQKKRLLQEDEEDFIKKFLNNKFIPIKPLSQKPLSQKYNPNFFAQKIIKKPDENINSLKYIFSKKMEISDENDISIENNKKIDKNIVFSDSEEEKEYLRKEDKFLGFNSTNNMNGSMIDLSGVSPRSKQAIEGILKEDARLADVHNMNDSEEESIIDFSDLLKNKKTIEKNFNFGNYLNINPEENQNKSEYLFSKQKNNEKCDEKCDIKKKQILNDTQIKDLMSFLSKTFSNKNQDKNQIIEESKEDEF